MSCEFKIPNDLPPCVLVPGEVTRAEISKAINGDCSKIFSLERYQGMPVNTVFVNGQLCNIID